MKVYNFRRVPYRVLQGSYKGSIFSGVLGFGVSDS